MNEVNGKRPGLVPFQKFFAILGYAVFSLVPILALLEGVSWFLWSVHQKWNTPLRRVGPHAENVLNMRRGVGTGKYMLLWDPLAGPSASPAYEGYAWAEDFWREQRARDELETSPLPYEPFRIWGTPRSVAKYINVDATEMGAVRRTVNPLRPACKSRKALKVWFLGGSTAWGTGTPDFATIPSYLSARLNAGGDDRCVEVTNLGVDGYNTNQEIIYLIQQLQAGRRPEVVIFYDGINDAYAGAYWPGIPSTHEGYIEVKAKFESRIIDWPGLGARSYFLKVAHGALRRLKGTSVTGAQEQDLPALAKATMDNYEANLRLVECLAQAYGFKAHFFWQPTLLYGGKPQVPFEGAIRDTGQLQHAVQAVYEEAERRAAASGKLILLSHLFDQIREPLYVDFFHLGPQGNEVVATAVANRLLPLLLKSAPKSPSGDSPSGKRPPFQDGPK